MRQMMQTVRNHHPLLAAPRWKVKSRVATGNPGDLLTLQALAHANINQRWQQLPQLARLGQHGGRPGWALRRAGPEGRPTVAEFAQDPGQYVLAMLDRVYVLVNQRWRQPGLVATMPGGGSRCDGA
jgi:hypothetical protein